MLSFSIGLLLAAAPAPPPEVSCVLDQISAEDRVALGDSAQRQAPSLGPAGDRLQVAAAACRDRLGWTAEQSGTMAALALSLVLRDEAARALAEGGIPPERIDRWFAAQSLAVRTDSRGIDAASEQLVNALAAQGYPLQTISAQGSMIGVYFGALLVIERIGLGMPLD